MNRCREEGFLRLPPMKRLVRCVRQALAWFGSREARLRQRSRRVISASPQRTQLIYFEALEPRVYLSADLGAGGANVLPPTDVAGAQGAIVISVAQLAQSTAPTPVRIDLRAGLASFTDEDG